MAVPAVIVGIGIAIAEQIARRFVDAIFDGFMGSAGGEDGLILLNEEAIHKIEELIDEKIEAAALSELSVDLKSVTNCFAKYLDTREQYILDYVTLESANLMDHLKAHQLTAHDSFHSTASYRLTILYERWGALANKERDMKDITNAIQEYNDHSLLLENKWLEWHNGQCGGVKTVHHYTGTDRTEYCNKISYHFYAYGKKYDLGSTWQVRLSGSGQEFKNKSRENKERRDEAYKNAVEKREKIVAKYLQDLHDQYIDPASRSRFEWKDIPERMLHLGRHLGAHKVVGEILGPRPVKRVRWVKGPTKLPKLPPGGAVILGRVPSIP